MKKLSNKKRREIYLDIAQNVHYALGIYSLCDSFLHRHSISRDTEILFQELALFRPEKNEDGVFWWDRHDLAVRQTCMLICYEMCK